jgi:hypothetical protein
MAKAWGAGRKRRAPALKVPRSHRIIHEPHCAGSISCTCRTYFDAVSFALRDESVEVWNPEATMIVHKRDAITLAQLCLATQKKFVLVDLKRYTKDLRELEALRKFTKPRKR